MRSSYPYRLTTPREVRREPDCKLLLDPQVASLGHNNDDEGLDTLCLEDEYQGNLYEHNYNDSDSDRYVHMGWSDDAEDGDSKEENMTEAQMQALKVAGLMPREGKKPEDKRAHGRSLIRGRPTHRAQSCKLLFSRVRAQVCLAHNSKATPVTQVGLLGGNIPLKPDHTERVKGLEVAVAGN